MELNERVTALEVRMGILDRDFQQHRQELHEATTAVRDLAEEMRKVTDELRNAVAQVAKSAAKPFENLSWGWRVLAGIGSLAIGAATFVFSVLGAIAYLKAHHP